MKFVALVSGGKDSICAIYECLTLGHELVACVHLARPATVGKEEEEESYMYQSAASEVVATQVQECLGVPCILYPRRGGVTRNTSLVFTDDDDEVHDLEQALLRAKQEFPQAAAVCSGAILSTYQRVRVEAVCARLNLTSLAYLWRHPAGPAALLRYMVTQVQLQGVLCKTAAPPGLVPQRHLGKSLADLVDHFDALHKKYQFHVTGEGGEYESLVLYCPKVFQRRLVLDATEIVEDDQGVGELRILQWHSEPVEEDGESNQSESDSAALHDSPASAAPLVQPSLCDSPVFSPPPTGWVAAALPRVRRISGGLWHVSQIMSATITSGSDEATARHEAREIFALLQQTLTHHDCTATDVVMVHVYLSQMHLFAAINEEYREFFGIVLPPSRCCVALGKQRLPGQRQVALDCLVQCGSGSYMRLLDRSHETAVNPYTRAALANTNSQLRQVLHVQSRSYWAPTCVGPYSQANTLRGSLHFIAGQIGLKAATMALMATDDVTVQYQRCWQHVAAILDALQGGTLTDILSCLVYITDAAAASIESLAETIAAVANEQIVTNAGVVTGRAEGLERGADAPLLHGGYEDEETMLQLMGTAGADVGASNSNADDSRKTLAFPILWVQISEMPVKSQVEVEVVAATSRASQCLSIHNFCQATRAPALLAGPVVTRDAWDTGHDFEASPVSSATSPSVDIQSYVRYIGVGCAAFATVTASLPSLSPSPPSGVLGIDLEHVLCQMLQAAFNAVSQASCGMDAGDDSLNLRMYYRTGEHQLSDQKCLFDGDCYRLAIYSAVAATWPSDRQPAITLIPVSNMGMVFDESACENNNVLFVTMQLQAIDVVKMETEMWIHSGR
jgi:diphthine-ammonia ligase